MSNVTIVVYDKKIVSRENKVTYVFKTIGGKSNRIWVHSFKDGVVTLDPMIGFIIDEIANVISGCFNKNSNFPEELSKVFKKEKRHLKRINFEFDDVLMSVTSRNADKNQIVTEWEKKLINSVAM